MIYTRYYREALVKMLEGNPEFVADDLGEGGAESLEKVGTAPPTVLIVDLPYESIALFVRQAHATAPTINILGFNRGETERELLALFECGLTGFVAHDSAREEIIDTIRLALRGEFMCPPRIASALVRRVNAAGEPARIPHTTAMLSPRELQIARHLEQGRTNKEIASWLAIEVSTVKNHVHNILRKLDARRRNEAAARLRTRSPGPPALRGSL